MVSERDSGSRGPVSNPGRGHFVVFLGKTLYSHSLFPARSGIHMATSKLSEKPGGRNAGGATCDGLASHPGGVAILLVASCYRNRDKLL